MHGDSKMKRILALLLAVFVFFACTDDTGTNSKHEEVPSSVVGWRSAGFTPVISFEWGGGLQNVTHSGNWLVLMDAWTSPIEGKSGKSTYSPRLFISRLGSDIWDTLVPPTSAYVKRIYADSFGVYIGTYNSEVFEYNPEKKEWKNLSVKKTNDSLWYHIYGIQRFNGRLIVSMAGYTESMGYYAKLLLQEGSEWLELQLPRIRKEMFVDSVIYDVSKTEPLLCVKAAEMDGNLYVGTGDGVWKLDEASLSWTELPKFPKMKWNANYHDVYEVEDLVVYKGALIAVDGTNDRVYQWDGSSNWLALDSMILPTIIRNGDSSYNIYRSSLRDIKDLATDGKHLFISGDASYPKVYMGDYGEPYGNIPKGWRAIMLGWCAEKRGCVSKDATYSLDIVGDTIYAAAWEGLFKMPLRDLDSAIAGQSDFKGFEKWQ